MPIQCSLTIPPLSDAAFEEIDHAVMACAYASQNSLGRLYDERVYENDMAARLKEHGFKEVHTQVPVTVTRAKFSKTYRLDLVVSGMVYELKTVAAWAPEHDTQAIHYAALLGTDRVKLLNFRPAKVTGKLVRCPMGRLDRTQVQFTDARWKPISHGCEPLKRQMGVLLADWGAYLERLRFTCLQGIQWINLNHANIEFITLQNGKGMEATE